MVYSKNKKRSQTYFPTFTQIFSEFDDETLIELALYNPSALKKMCQFLTIDLHLEEEWDEKMKKGS